MPDPMFPPADDPRVLEGLTTNVLAGGALDPEQIDAAVAALTDEGVAEAEKADFLRALRTKGETPGEIAGFAQALLRRAVDPGLDQASLPGPTLDVCGTGGDRLGLFNVSTTAAFVLAAGGVCVVKHGNRAVTSKSGGADVLAALGVPLELSPAGLRHSLEATGFGFLFAPFYHPAFRAVAPARRLLAAEGLGTIFNLLGPLLNPARPACQLVGVFAPEWTHVYAEVLQRLGRRSAWVVHGAGGMDELSTFGETCVSRFGHGSGQIILDEVLIPEDAGLGRTADLEILRGGDAEANARTLVGILTGEINDARSELVLLNAAAGFVVAGVAENLRAGVSKARTTIADGGALRALRRSQASQFE